MNFRNLLKFYLHNNYMEQGNMPEVFQEKNAKQYFSVKTI